MYLNIIVCQKILGGEWWGTQGSRINFFMSMKITHQKVELGIINAFSCSNRHFDMCFNWFHIFPPSKISFQAKKWNLRKSKMADPRWRTPKFGKLMKFLSVSYFLITTSIYLHLIVLIEWKKPVILQIFGTFYGYSQNFDTLQNDVIVT